MSADLHHHVLFEKHRVTVSDRGDQLELLTADAATLSADQALEVAEVLKRWATRLVPVGKPR